MNAFVRKEVRLLLPNFIIGLLLAFSVLAYADAQGPATGFGIWFAIIPTVLCPALIVMLALDSFGRELNAGTFSNLLVQPISRQKIWRTKTSLLAAGVALIWCVWIGCFTFSHVLHGDWNGDWLELVMGSGLFALTVFAGGLWTVLLFRQVAAAFWFTVLTPGVLLMIIQGLLEGHPKRILFAQVVIGVSYSVTGFLFARWLFLRAQDVQWTGGTIVLPEMRGLARFNFFSGAMRIWRPRAALLFKEFQLHQSQYVLAGALALLHLGVILWRNLKSDLAQHQDLEFILKAFWCLWLVMPFLVGCAAVAEERKIGTLESQLGLPVRRRTQFITKVAVALFLSVLLGVVMPLLLEGTRILPHFIHFTFNSPNKLYLIADHSNSTGNGPDFLALTAGGSVGLMFLNLLAWLSPFLPFLSMASICMGICALALYASSLARNTLQALGPAVLGIMLAWFLLFGAFHTEAVFNYPLWRGWLIYLIGVPVMALTLAALAFWNYKRVLVGWNVWRRNLLTVLMSLAFVIVATAGIYHRAWERLTPFEPAHGAARLTLANPAILRHDIETVSARLPDGRMWIDYLDEYDYSTPNSPVLGTPTSLTGGYFLDGSNWLSAKQDWGTREMVGFKTDGTLWVSEKPIGRTEFKNGRTIINPEKLVRFGNETNWQSAVRIYRSEILVKNDGTLWRCGTTNSNSRNYKWPGLPAFTPYQLGAESNWAEAFSIDYMACLRKTDGSVWTFYGDTKNSDREKIELEPRLVVQRAKNLESGRLLITATIEGNLGYRMGVRSDGTFRIWADQQLVADKEKHYGSYEWSPVDLQIGSETNWVAVAGRGESIVTLKRDGSLWLWNYRRDWRRGWDRKREESEIINTIPTRLGTHTDWIAIDGAAGGIVSLAADGSLWFWPLAPIEEYLSRDNGFVPLLDISRKPQKIAGIFDKK